MESLTFKTSVGCSQSETDALEENLIDCEMGLDGPMNTRGGMSNGQDISKVRREIIGIYRSGIEIASTIEHYPLKAATLAASLPSDLQLAASEECLHLFSAVFSISLPEGITPAQAEFAINFDEKSSGQKPISIIRFFPVETRGNVVRAEIATKVGLTASLDFSVPEEYSAMFGFPTLAANAGISSSLALGPFSYSIRKARILADGLYKPRVQWKYLISSELGGASEFQSWVIVRTPHRTKEINIVADLGVLPYKREWLIFKEYLPVMRHSLKIDAKL